MSKPDTDEFFVGYLPLPPRLRRFLGWVAALVIVGALSLSALAAALRDAPAKTQAQQTSLVGRMDAQAYGVLWTLSEHGAPSPVLLSRGGKFGAPETVLALDGQLVELKGLLLEREGYRLLEVNQVDKAPKLTAQERARLTPLPRTARGTHTLRGEIVDIKCWLGRMKPGDGRTHRACAQFCIAGGIPPVLVSRDPQGKEQRYVLTDKNKRPVNDAVLPYVAEAVEVDGELENEGALKVFRIDPARIRRL